MDAGTFIKTRVAALRDRADEFYEIQNGISNDFNSWSALKLILHSAAIRMYTNVHNNQGTGDIFYIDALAGSGVSMYNNDRCFVGSPLLACRNAEIPFTKMYFVDSDGDYCDALEHRLEHAFSLPDYTEPSEYEVIEGNINKEIEYIVNEIQDVGSYDDRYNYYCFVDNQGLNFDWSSVEQLTPTPYGDLLINLPIAHGVGRLAQPNNLENLNNFYGGNMERFTKGRTTRNQLRKEYCDRLAHRNRAIQEMTRIQTNIGSFNYDLLYATRKTGGDNGYMDVIRYVKNFIESVHSGHIDRMLEVLDGNQMVIDDHLPDDDIEDELPEDDLDDAQRGLSDFS